ncbi:MAG: DNA-binding protein [Actinomycetota bacterium]|nr:DNA-binding protein [Actinomycetota bacterium]
MHPNTPTNAHASTTALTLRLPTELAEALKNFAFVTDTSGNEVIKRALIEYLQAHGRPELVRAAFQKVLDQHGIALDKLKDL